MVAVVDVEEGYLPARVRDSFIERRISEVEDEEEEVC